MQVPNPFKLYDLGLITYVFKPVSWWSEDRFGKDAVELGSYSVLLSLPLIALMGFLLGDVFMTISIGFIGGLKYRSRGSARSSFNRNTKTGLNRLKHDGFHARMIAQASILAITAIGWSVRWAYEEIGAVSPEWGIVTLAFASILVLVVPAYFDSTDTMPPGYGQKEPQFV